MTDPMTPERLAEIREHLARARDLNVCLDDFHVMLAGDARDLLAEVDRLTDALRLATRAQMRHVRAELLAEEGRMLDARVHVNPRAKKQLDAAARRLRALATSLDGENHG